jgi:antitoxin ParD1/3/4
MSGASGVSKASRLTSSSLEFSGNQKSWPICFSFSAILGSITLVAACQNLTFKEAGWKSRDMNVSLPGAMEEFVRQKVAIGDYETASEVVREGLRLLKQRDEVWTAEVRDKVKQGMDSIRAGRTIPAEQVQVEMSAFKKRWKKNRNLQ